MLTAEHLGKSFYSKPPVEAVSALDFSIERGEFVAIVGRSGSGKSTLLAMLGGLCRPTSGKTLFNDIDHWSLTNDEHSHFRNHKVGYVFQFASLLPTMRIIDNVALPALIGGTLPALEAYARARELLAQAGLSARADFYPHQLSGGEQRRAAIARALINSPELLLADEPTADLDWATEQEILNLLIAIQKAFDLTMVVVTHNMEIAARADRILQMEAGRIISTRNSEPAHDIAGQRLASAEQAEQVRRIFSSSPDKANAERIRMGDGFEAFIGRLAMVITLAIALVFAINFGISRYENALIDQKEAAHQALEDLAMNGLRAEVKDITFGPGNSYVVSIYLRNTTGEQPIYVLAPTVRGFVQTGSTWQEVPLKPASSESPKLLKVTSTQICRYILEPKVDSFTQIIPYYMHVRLSNDMLISPSSQPTIDNLIERNDNYYVYLKPHDASDAGILAKMKFPGAPPVWIPMPPH